MLEPIIGGDYFGRFSQPTLRGIPPCDCGPDDQAKWQAYKNRIVAEHRTISRIPINR
jgi:hypothetical protein